MQPISFQYFHLFENVQAISNDGSANTFATSPNACMFVLHMAYDTNVPHNNTTDPHPCIIANPTTHRPV